MRKKITRSLVMLLCMAMIAALCGMAAFAEDAAAVAEVDGVGYASLEAAFVKAADGSTVKLLSDAAVKAQMAVDKGRKLTFDLNGFNVNADMSDAAGSAFIVEDGELNITGNGTITAKMLAFRVHANTVYNDDSKINSVLTIGENVTVVSTDYCAVYYKGNGSVVNLHGKVKVTGDYAAIQGNGRLESYNNLNNGRTELNIYPEAVVEAKASGIYHPQSGVLNVEGKIITETGCGVEMRNGALNVSGNAFIETKDPVFEVKKNDDGATTIGAAVAVTPYGNERVLSINITGGTLKGKKALSYSNPKPETGFKAGISVTGGTFSTDITEALANADVTSNISAIAVVANEDGTYSVKTREEKFENVAVIQRTSDNKLTFLAGISFLDYEKAGFRVTVGGSTTEIAANTVYTELKKADGTTVISSEEFGTPYFFAADIEIADTSIKEFTVTPFATLLNGENIEASTATAVKVGGAE